LTNFNKFFHLYFITNDQIFYKMKDGGHLVAAAVEAGDGEYPVCM
jgi:hypothetical protein